VRRSLAVLRAAYYASLDRLPFFTHKTVVVVVAVLVATLALLGGVQFIVATDWPVPDPGPAATPLTSTTLGVVLTTTPPTREPPSSAPGPGSASGPGASEAGVGGSGEPRGGAGPGTTRGPGRSTTSGTTTTTGPSVTVCVTGVTCVTVP
jgi:hypothetical protein